jgi:hypothetical protein
MAGMASAALWKRSWPAGDHRKPPRLHTELVPYMYSYVVECNGAPPSCERCAGQVPLSVWQ